MAQSRMAGVAMGLGPSDLADVGEAQTLATNKMGMEQGQQASIIYDMPNNKITMINDGEPNLVYSDGRTTSYRQGPNSTRNPVPRSVGKKDIFDINDAGTTGQLYQVHGNNIREGRSINRHTNAQHIYDSF